MSWLVLDTSKSLTKMRLAPTGGYGARGEPSKRNPPPKPRDHYLCSIGMPSARVAFVLSPSLPYRYLAHFSFPSFVHPARSNSPISSAFLPGSFNVHVCSLFK
jgi:hypothetical protein